MERSNGWRAVARSQYWREEDARVVVEAWRGSGETLAGFCRAHGLSAKRLSRWAARLDTEEVRFHPVVLTKGGDTPNPIGQEACEAIEIELPGGAMVRLPSGFLQEDLERILAALESRC